MHKKNQCSMFFFLKNSRMSILGINYKKLRCADLQKDRRHILSQMHEEGFNTKHKISRKNVAAVNFSECII